MMSTDFWGITRVICGSSTLSFRRVLIPVALFLLWLNAGADDYAIDYIDVEYRHNVSVSVFDSFANSMIPLFYQINCRDCSWSAPGSDIMAFVSVGRSAPSYCGPVRWIGNGLHRDLWGFIDGSPMRMRAAGVNGGGVIAYNSVNRACFQNGESSVEGRAGNSRYAKIKFEIQKRMLVTMVGYATYGMSYAGRAYLPGGVTGGGSLIGYFRLGLRNGESVTLLINRTVEITNPGRLDYFEERLVLEPGTYEVEFQTITLQNFQGNAIPDDQCGCSDILAVMSFGSTSGIYVWRHLLRPPSGYNIVEVLRADIDGSGYIDEADLLYILWNFGKKLVVNIDEMVNEFVNQCVNNPDQCDFNIDVDLDGALADVNFDGSVDDGDLINVLSLFGYCYLE